MDSSVKFLLIPVLLILALVFVHLKRRQVQKAKKKEANVTMTDVVVSDPANVSNDLSEKGKIPSGNVFFEPAFPAYKP